MKRLVLPEILDSLPEDDVEAVSNRKDLRRINMLMGNYGWIASQVRAHRREGERLLELGAGMGDFGVYLAQKKLLDMPMTGLDLISRPEGWPESAAWWQGDVKAYKGWSKHAICAVNLFLHHLKDEELAKLGEHVRQCRVIIANELVRRPIYQKLLHLTRLWGAGRITLHDGHVSVQAGFLGKELPDLLGLDSKLWHVTCQESMIGSYRMVAIKKDVLSEVRDCG